MSFQFVPLEVGEGMAHSQATGWVIKKALEVKYFEILEVCITTQDGKWNNFIFIYALLFKKRILF